MKHSMLAGIIALTVTPALAGDVMQWQDNNLSYIYGDNFKVDPETQHTVTFEHFSGWSMGDLFLFVDGVYFDGARDSNGNQVSYYSEISPRLSAGKISGKDLSVLFIQDFLISGCYEFGEGADENTLIGAAVDLDIPGFDFVQLNAYRRYNGGESECEAYQVTPVWKLSVPVGETSVIFDGFIDWVIGEDNDSLHICPQFKVDIGPLLGMKEGALLAGIEYDYWKNKYRIKNSSALDTDQNTFSGLVKYHF